MNLTNFQKFINAFDFKKLEATSPFQFREDGIRCLKIFEIDIMDDIKQMKLEERSLFISQIKYSLNIKLNEFQVGFETIQFWLNKFGITYNELINKSGNKDLVVILNDSTIVNPTILHKTYPYFENIQEDFCIFWSGWLISQAIEIVDNIQNKLIRSQDIKSQFPFEPLLFGDQVAKNEIPTIFYNLFVDRKLKSSRVNVIRMLKFVFRDKDGNELSESTLNDIFNKSKEQSRSKKL